ncbi:MAG: GumC family protein, partial [Cyanophyceae cyanobacterium]
MQSRRTYPPASLDPISSVEMIGGSLNQEVDVLRVVQRRWLPALLVAGSMFAGVYSYTNSQVPRYQAEILILLDQQASLPVVGSGQPTSITRDLSTEIQILRSRPLVERAIAKLPEPFQDTFVGSVISSLTIRQFGNAQVLSVVFAGTEPERIKAVLDALGETYVAYSLESRQSQASNAITFIEGQLPEARAALEQSNSAIRQLREANSILDPDSFGQSVVATRQSLTGQIQQTQIAIDQTRQREQVLLSQLGQDPAVAMEMNTLSQDSGYQSLTTQLQQAELDLALERIQYRDDYPSVQDLQARRDQILALLQQRIEQVLGRDLPASQVTGQASLPLPVMSDSLVGDPLAQSGTVAVGNPIASNTNAPIDVSDLARSNQALQQTLTQQVMQTQVELAVQNAQLASLRQVEGEITQQFDRIPQLQQSYAELQRQNQVESALVNTFVARLQELRIAEAQETLPWRVLQPASIPRVPISPNRQRNTVLALFAGGLLGLGTALLLERLDQRIKGVEEAKRLTALPMLGAIPKVVMDGLTAAVSQKQAYKQMPFTESFRSTALNFGYLGSSEEMRVFCFTSGLTGEGKSTVSFHVANALAELGHQVLLVDADMRRPTQHKIIQETNAVGLSTVLVGDIPWQDATHLLVGNRLHLLTAGPVPPNPVVLLGSSTMERLLEEWRQAYRYVLIDTPPIVGIADAQSVANQVDGVVLV